MRLASFRARVAAAPAATPFRVGALHLYALRDMANVVPNDNSVFGVGQTPAAVAGVLKAAGAPTDHIALAIAKNAVDLDYDHDMDKDQRTFLYMPFEHSEDIKDQLQSLLHFTALGDPHLLEFARKHHDVIERFGADMAEDILEFQLLPTLVDRAVVLRISNLISRNLFQLSLDYLSQPDQRAAIRSLAEEQVLMLFTGASVLQGLGQLRLR